MGFLPGARSNELENCQDSPLVNHRKPFETELIFKKYSLVFLEFYRGEIMFLGRLPYFGLDELPNGIA